MDPVTPLRSLLSVRLSAGYKLQEPVLDDLDLEIGVGEAVGLVGESGSGKSTLARSLLRLERFSGGWSRGSLVFEGQELMRCSERDLRSLRGRRMALVLQSPMTALNPSLRIETQLKEAWRAHSGYKGAAAFDEVASSALTDVHLPSDRAFLRRYPGQISVGQAQRVLIAMAILHRPALLIADEATSSLDALTRAGVLNLFQELNRRLNMALLFISHDLPSVLEVSDRVAVLRGGRIVETGSPEDIVSRPAETYTRRLVEAVLSASPTRR